MGVPLTLSMLLTPATSTDEAGSGYAEVDLTGARFDFTGMTGLETNALVVSVSAVSGPVTSEQEFYLVEATDSVVISLGFLDANVGSLAGYFGTLTEGTTGIVDLLDTVPLPEPVVDMEGAEASLNFSNTVAADFRLHLDTVQFDQTLVNGDFIGSHDIPSCRLGERPARAECVAFGPRQRVELLRPARDLPTATCTRRDG